MGFGDPLRFKRKERRCRHFDDDGTPKLRDECPYRSFECWFTHPDEPGWRDCPPRYMGGKYPPGPSSHRDRRGSFSRHHGWDRDRSWSRERERDRGWGDREALRERERGRERSRSRERGRVFAPYGYARAVEREDSVASSREGNSHDNIVHQTTSGSRTEPDTPVIPTSGTRFGGWTSLQSPITNITTPDPTSHKTVKHTSININVTDNNTPPPPPSVTPSPFPPLPSAEPSQSPHFARTWATITAQDFRPSATSTSSVPNEGFVVPSLPPPSTGASTSSFAIPPPPSTTTTTSSIPPSPTTSAPPLTANLPQVIPREEQSRTPVFVKSTIPFKFKFSNSPSRSSSPPAVTTDISSSSPIVSSTLPFDVVATATGSTSSAAGSTAPVLTRTIDQSSDIDIPMTALSISTAIPGLASVQNAQASPSTPQEVGPQTQQPGVSQQLPEHPGMQSLPDPISQPLPPPPPLPPLPSFEVAETPMPELSHEAKLELWNKRIRTIADLLMYKDKIQQLTSDIDDLTRYSTSHFFTGDPEEKERIESNLMELESTRETMKQSVQKALDELAGSDTWPSAPVVEDVRKQNEKMKEYVVGLADVMKEVSVTLGELAELARIGKKKQKMRRRARARRKDKGKEKEVEPVTTVDAVELEAGEIPTPIAEVVSTLSDARQEVEDAEDAAESDVETSKRSRELADIRAKFESLEDLLQSVVYSLDEAESTWMAGVKEMFQDLVLEQKRTIRERVDQHKGLIEQHAAKLKSSLDQVSDSIATTNTNVTNAVNETAQALEKIVRLQNERDTILAEHERFFNEELPRLRTQISDYEVQREKGQKRLGVLEAALNAYVNRPPSASPSTALPTTSTNNHKRHHPLIESDYLLQSIKPQLTHLLREGVKPLVEEVRKRVEEMVNAQREEMYANVWNKIGFTWQVLGKVHKSAEIDLGPILRSADSGAGEGGGVGGGSGSVDTVVDDVVPSGSGKPVTSESVNVGTGPTAIGGSTGTTPGLARSMANSNGSANTAGPSGNGSTAPRS